MTQQSFFPPDLRSLQKQKNGEPRCAWKKVLRPFWGQNDVPEESQIRKVFQHSNGGGGVWPKVGTKNHQTFQVSKMEVLAYIICKAYVRENPPPKTALQYLHFRYLSPLMKNMRITIPWKSNHHFLWLVYEPPFFWWWLTSRVYKRKLRMPHIPTIHFDRPSLRCFVARKPWLRINPTLIHELGKTNKTTLSCCGSSTNFSKLATVLFCSAGLFWVHVPPRIPVTHREKTCLGDCESRTKP